MSVFTFQPVITDPFPYTERNLGILLSSVVKFERPIPRGRSGVFTQTPLLSLATGDLLTKRGLEFAKLLAAFPKETLNLEPLIRTCERRNYPDGAAEVAHLAILNPFWSLVKYLGNEGKFAIDTFDWAISELLTAKGVTQDHPDEDQETEYDDAVAAQERRVYEIRAIVENFEDFGSMQARYVGGLSDGLIAGVLADPDNLQVVLNLYVSGSALLPDCVPYILKIYASKDVSHLDIFRKASFPLQDLYYQWTSIGAAILKAARKLADVGQMTLEDVMVVAQEVDKIDHNWVYGVRNACLAMRPRIKTADLLTDGQKLLILDQAKIIPTPTLSAIAYEAATEMAAVKDLLRKEGVKWDRKTWDDIPINQKASPGRKRAILSQFRKGIDPDDIASDYEELNGKEIRTILIELGVSRGDFRLGLTKKDPDAPFAHLNWGDQYGVLGTIVGDYSCYILADLADRINEGAYGKLPAGRKMTIPRLSKLLMHYGNIDPSDFRGVRADKRLFQSRWRNNPSTVLEMSTQRLRANPSEELGEGVALLFVSQAEGLVALTRHSEFSQDAGVWDIPYTPERAHFYEFRRYLADVAWGDVLDNYGFFPENFSDDDLIHVAKIGSRDEPMTVFVYNLSSRDLTTWVRQANAYLKENYATVGFDGVEVFSMFDLPSNLGALARLTLSDLF